MEGNFPSADGKTTLTIEGGTVWALDEEGTLVDMLDANSPILAAITCNRQRIAVVEHGSIQTWVIIHLRDVRGWMRERVYAASEQPKFLSWEEADDTRYPPTALRITGEKTVTRLEPTKKGWEVASKQPLHTP